MPILTFCVNRQHSPPFSSEADWGAPAQDPVQKQPQGRRKAANRPEFPANPRPWDSGLIIIIVIQRPRALWGSIQNYSSSQPPFPTPLAPH